MKKRRLSSARGDIYREGGYFSLTFYQTGTCIHWIWKTKLRISVAPYCFREKKQLHSAWLRRIMPSIIQRAFLILVMQLLKVPFSIVVFCFSFLLMDFLIIFKREREEEEEENTYRSAYIRRSSQLAPAKARSGWNVYYIAGSLLKFSLIINNTN